MTGKASRRGKALQKQRYDSLKAAGLCVTCGRNRAKESSIRCVDCLRRKKVSDNRGRIRKANTKLREQSISKKPPKPKEIDFPPNGILSPQK